MTTGPFGYAEILVSFYYCASAFYLFLWIKNKQKTALVLSFICSALTLWTKTEGLMLLCVNCAVIATYLSLSKLQHWRVILQYLGCCGALLIAYLAFIKFSGVGVHAMASEHSLLNVPVRLIQNIDRLGAILYEYQKHIFGPKKWNMIWIIFSALTISQIHKLWTKPTRYLSIMIAYIFLGYLSIYLLVDSYQWILEKTASRFILHFLPFLIFYIAILFEGLNFYQKAHK